MLELGLIAVLGFVGSFGHCVGMCGPIAIAFSLTNAPGQEATPSLSPRQQVRFHLCLNCGRLASYVLVGAAIGGLGSVLVASGQVAGVGSILRRTMAIATGTLLIGLGLRQIAPELLPKLPLLHPIKGALHARLQTVMTVTSQSSQWWTPLVLGFAWGLIPCGFLYTAQLKAAATSSPWLGAATMGAFGLGTLPTMIGMGTYSAWLNRDRRSQLFQFGGWLTLLIGVLTLFRTGDLMVDYAGHLALLCLALALVARPLGKLWHCPLKFRRLLGVSGFVLAVAHTVHMLEHSWNWNPAAVRFMLLQHQWGMVAGMISLLLLLPLALTSTDGAQRYLGRAWRSLHLLSVPALICGCGHAVLAGSSYLGSLQTWGMPMLMTSLLLGGLLLVLAVRSAACWKLLGLERWYTAVRPKPMCPSQGSPQRSPQSTHHS
ncbi:MAG: sulfite exporter TauE/SafE family protein [Leptolyngbyaceae cyanobacterium]